MKAELLVQMQGNNHSNDFETLVTTFNISNYVFIATAAA